MNLSLWIDAFSMVFNIIGMVLGVGGLLIAQRSARRWPGYSMTALGFLIATLPLWYQFLTTLAGTE
ncbi:hypothetical protein P1P91_11190 [Halomonas piscis]|uniref:DUF2788 domain-containing protein n=1 Tax=Halomonas piscis TaxID=3031727 RepID=A0ABY9YWZ6_9GAMM|nr:hypothetical protein [Halomonas piscis]WNK19410.1 hypothetical protein P1P91_11190 [Halomonas piscis]